MSASTQASDANGSRVASGPMRIDGVDALRGVAILAMIAYHFCFDLRFYRVVAWDFEHGPFWLLARTLIAGTFLLVAGVGLVLADRAGSPPAHFWKRFGIIAACALAVSVGSYLVFPQTFIYFGVLHCIAIASVLAWPLVRHPALALVTGALRHRGRTALQRRGVQRPPDVVDRLHDVQAADRGLRSALPVGRRDADRDRRRARARQDAVPPARAARRRAAMDRPAGRHSLAIYMIHQPILLGVLWIFVGR